MKVYPAEVNWAPGARGKAQAGSVNTFSVEVVNRFHDETPPGIVTSRFLTGMFPVLLIEIDTKPPSFHVEDSAKEIPARQVVVEDPVPGVTGVDPEDDEVAEVAVLEVAWDDDEDAAEEEEDEEVEELAWEDEAVEDEAVVAVEEDDELETEGEAEVEQGAVPHWH